MPEPSNAPEPAEAGLEERAVIQELTKYCKWLNLWATVLQSLTVLMALAAIVFSLLVATFTGNGNGNGTQSGFEKFVLSHLNLKELAFLSALCTALFSSFRLSSKAADFRTAYRVLHADLMRYRIGKISASHLIATYRKAEEQIGQVEVQGLGDSKSTNQ